MRDDSRIGQLGDDAIGDVACAFARAARQQHHVSDFECAMHLRPQCIRIVSRDAEAEGLAAQFANGISEHLGVGVVDARRLHRLAGRDDFVAGREDRDDRLAPDVYAGDADRGEHSGIAAGQDLSAPQYRFPCRDVGARERHSAPRRHCATDA